MRLSNALCPPTRLLLGLFEASRTCDINSMLRAEGVCSHVIHSFDGGSTSEGRCAGQWCSPSNHELYHNTDNVTQHLKGVALVDARVRTNAVRGW
jgi:hypothetical protein